jgi:hypothetical protein
MLVILLALGRPDLPPASPMTGLERQRLTAHLEMTASWLADEVSGLSPAQLTFRRAPGEWNILQVLDHLVVVGPIYWEDLQRAVKGRPSTRVKTGTDAGILWYGVDRTYREKAIAPEEPKGQVRDPQTALTEFREAHARLLRYVTTTDDDLRSRVVERQGCDAYQWALLISAHVQRHVLQIREIKSHQSYPRR